MNIERSGWSSIFSCQSPLKGNKKSKTGGCLSKLFERMKKVFHSIIFGYPGATALTVICLWANPTLSTACFIIGIILSKQVEETSEKIKLIWKHLSWPLFVLGGLTYFLALEVFLGACSCLWASYLGHYLYKKCLEKEELAKANAQEVP